MNLLLLAKLEIKKVYLVSISYILCIRWYIYILTFSSSISWLVTTPYFGISVPRNNVSSVTSLFAPIICPIKSDFPDCCDVDLLFITWEDSWFVRFPTFFIESLLSPCCCPDVIDDLLTWGDPDSLLCSRFSSAEVFNVT